MINLFNGIKELKRLDGQKAQKRNKDVTGGRSRKSKPGSKPKGGTRSTSPKLGAGKMVPPISPPKRGGAKTLQAGRKPPVSSSARRKARAKSKSPLPGIGSRSPGAKGKKAGKRGQAGATRTEKAMAFPGGTQGALRSARAGKGTKKKKDATQPKSTAFPKDGSVKLAQFLEVVEKIAHDVAGAAFDNGFLEAVMAIESTLATAKGKGAWTGELEAEGAAGVADEATIKAQVDDELAAAQREDDAARVIQVGYKKHLVRKKEDGAARTIQKNFRRYSISKKNGMKADNSQGVIPTKKDIKRMKKEEKQRQKKQKKKK